MSPATIHQISAPALAASLQGDRPPLLLDVREPWELETAQIPGALNLPLGTLPGGLAALDASAPIVVVCHHGGRSMHAAQFLVQQGFAHVSNLTGGIDAWSLQVDPGVPRY